MSRMISKVAWKIIGSDPTFCGIVFTETFPIPLPNNKILDWTKLKAFADNKLNVAEMVTSVIDRIENTVGKGANAGYQHFLLFPQCFPN